MILMERPEGIAWVVAHDADTGAMAVAVALPEWASAELAAAWEDRVLASAAGWCAECGAATPPAPGTGDLQPPLRVAPPHPPACRMSAEYIDRLEAACRPPGRRWIADTRDETLDLLAAYVEELAGNLARSAAGPDDAGR